MPRNDTLEELRPKQLKAIEGLLLGQTVVATAAQAGVCRETVHRWTRDASFRAALNRGRREFQDAIASTLLAAAVQAAETVAEAVREGDVRVSVQLLKGLGALTGEPLCSGSDDPEVLHQQQ